MLQGQSGWISREDFGLLGTFWIVDDHPLFRSAVVTVLAALDGAPAVAEFGSIGETVAALDAGKPPQAILLDLNLPDSRGYEGLATLREKSPGTPIIVMSAREEADVIRRAAALGAAGFVPKSASTDAIRDALATVSQGGSWWPETIEVAPRRTQLTPQQNRILIGLMEGRLNKQIAHDIGVSEATIKAHLTEMFRKLGVNNRTQAVIVARSLMRDEEQGGPRA